MKTASVLLDTPFALTRSAFLALQAFEATFSSRPAAVAGIRPQPAPSSRRGGVAILPIRGIIKQHPGESFIDILFGGTATEAIAARLLADIANPDIAAVVLDLDSPGGSTFGVSELANLIMSLRGRKPILAVANSTAASAAYHIAAACDQVYCTPGGQLGSVGVFLVHEDVSGALNQAGVKVTIVSAGKFKTRGTPFEPLSDDDKSHYQAVVDETWKQMTADIARGRRVSVETVRKGFGQGDVMGSRAALAAGLCDGIMTLAEVIPHALTVRAGGA